MLKKKMPTLLIIIILMLITALLCARSYKAFAEEVYNNSPEQVKNGQAGSYDSGSANQMVSQHKSEYAEL